MPNFNCECDDSVYANETLAELRLSLLERLGYAAQAANPPPGMAALLDNFLRRGQNFLFKRYKALHTERYFSWLMIVGERFYGISENDEQYDCGKILDPGRATWVGVEDMGGAWHPLVNGISPTLYTSANDTGLPCRYEIRQCIEVFPAPAEEYTLRIRGHFAPMRFTEDTDRCTVDSELLFLWALANAKNHYGQPDARDIAAEAQTYLRELVAEGHGTRRYVPGVEPVDTPPRPLLVD